MGNDPHLAALLPYQPSAGRRAHRAAGSSWLERHGLDVPADDVVITNGAQHAAAVVLASLTRPGDRVAVEAFTYPVFKLIAQMLGLRVTGIAMDKQGILPDAFEAACQAGDLKALYCIPTMHNPTTATLAGDRRAALAEIARRHGVALIEDDLMRLMTDAAPPPLATLAPDVTYYITSLSKTVAPGLRVGFIAGPRGSAQRLAGAVRATAWMSTPLGVEVAARWIADGTADRMLAARRQELAARRGTVRAALNGYTAACAPGSMNAWLQLPEPWTANAFVNEARQRGIVLTPAEAFAVDRRDRTPAVRICFGSAPDRARLEEALGVLTDLLERPPSEALPAIV
jgi:DNA-binding transcriptional MocR family regulator